MTALVDHLKELTKTANSNHTERLRAKAVQMWEELKASDKLPAMARSGKKEYYWHVHMHCMSMPTSDLHSIVYMLEKLAQEDKFTVLKTLGQNTPAYNYTGLKLSW